MEPINMESAENRLCLKCMLGIHRRKATVSAEIWVNIHHNLPSPPFYARSLLNAKMLFNSRCDGYYG